MVKHWFPKPNSAGSNPVLPESYFIFLFKNFFNIGQDLLTQLLKEEVSRKINKKSIIIKKKCIIDNFIN